MNRENIEVSVWIYVYIGKKIMMWRLLIRMKFKNFYIIHEVVYKGRIKALPDDDDDVDGKSLH